MPKKVVFTLMVKDESSIIERCLDSIVKLADLVIITDTGSTDDTIIKAGLFLQKNFINYKIYRTSFSNFATNRNALLELASQEPMDYVMQIDADEVLEFPQDIDVASWKDGLCGDYYDVIMRAGDLMYNLPRATSNKASLRYEGVTHEFLRVGGFYEGILPKVTIRQVNDSKRRVTNAKFADDAKLLEKALKTEKSEDLLIRYTFYLAQTYQAMNDFDKAKEYYTKRSQMTGWKDEVFYCHYQLGRIEEYQGLSSCVDNYMKAYEVLPTRVEPLAALHDHFVRRGHLNMAEILIPKIKSIPKPLGGLFIEENLYANNSNAVPVSTQ